ncbi:MAG: peroxidase-related enzyme [Alphaproteobacteria bacterium]|nr:peroxidase-related enzyme [Alphaproteobacteria bacterium]
MSDVIHDFTTEVPEWQPRVTPVDLENATPEQLEALKVTPSNTKVSDYVLTLAHDVEILQERSPLFNAIMYNRGGLGRTGRELGATAASIVNRCIYCAAVHASRYNQLTKSGEIMAALFEDGEEVRLAPYNQAIVDFSMKLSKSPPEATADDVGKLRDAGLSEEEIVDLILSTSLFAWANRLMHILGDPVTTGSVDIG